ncbi:TBC1 domain family member 26-like [Ochotona princeps]|uniref:TBC1 domain family member 26-like n=1 Tax=Ochotona princeps TaxID=9978 RepID=UPI002714EEE4|nr:TBC1 domain family member 26-like [Ochotona princeps]
MLKNYSKYHDSEKFHQRIFKGIPGQVRGKVWRLLLGVDAKKAQNPGKFEELKEQAKLRSNQFHQIDSAVCWTFRNHLMFQKRYGLK